MLLNNNNLEEEKKMSDNVFNNYAINNNFTYNEEKDICIRKKKK